MRAVYKYQLDRDVVQLPEGAEVLHVGVQENSLCAWALVDPMKRAIEPRFRVAGTGHPLDVSELGKFHGTHMLNDGALVFHVWEFPQ